ncbi:MAG: hypothetical protein J6A96_04295 [Clostridia bacterium]|nr:hypothetical protein [Clostridia bacterium]
MNEQEMKKKIKEAYESQSVDLLSQIESSCQQEKQADAFESSNRRYTMSRTLRSIIACTICLALFITGFGVGFVIPNAMDNNKTTFNDSIETFVYLDVNPSVELQVNNESKIVSCIPTNNDAEIILNGLELKGVDMNTALTAIIGSMYVNGYLSTDSNSILVSVNTSDEDNETSIIESITDRINKVFEKTDMECSIITQSVELNDELKQRAEENGVSVGKMHFIDKIIENREDFGDDDRPDLSHMSIKELDKMFPKHPNMNGENPPPLPENVEGMDSEFPPPSGQMSGVIEEPPFLPPIDKKPLKDEQESLEQYPKQKDDKSLSNIQN